MYSRNRACILTVNLSVEDPKWRDAELWNLVLKGFGFTSLEITLVTTPAFVIAFSTILLM
ncbi:hypothetical protein AJ79_04680 [Helicocarpus griseus UAMH5409]|uniref:Uncharacterized protein n=1 Tax=Helicocarpus griseus UAMH5409 TaxID=1447875 RepID=A0A2B7XS42_9EURO|nr:hypothetical protein AJ79_04680 [Helicocarpus griseus UAMH5409]